MTEATLCGNMRSDLLRLLPGAIITKHHDLSTAGIPDLSINWRQRTLWIEVKLLKPRETASQFKKHFDALQLANAILLDRQQQTFYFVAYPATNLLRSIIWKPSTLRIFLVDPRPYEWQYYAHQGHYEQGIEFLAARMGLNL